MFSSGGFGAFGQPAGYGFDFHGAAAGGVNGYSQWGQVPGGASGQFRGPELAAAAYQQTAVEERRVPQAEQAMQGLSLQHSTQQVFVYKLQMSNYPDIQSSCFTHVHFFLYQAREPETTPGKERAESVGKGNGVETSSHTHGRGSHESNGGPPTPGQGAPASGGSGKKMSWASIASQPAKPPPPPSKTKKPGVLQAPVVGGSGGSGGPSGVSRPPNMDIGTWDGQAKQNGGPPPLVTVQTQPPSHSPSSKPHNGPQNMGQQAPRGGPAWLPGGGPPHRGGRPPAPYTSNGGSGPPPLMGLNPPTPPSHPVLEELRSSNEYNPRYSKNQNVPKNKSLDWSWVKR